MIKNNSMLDAKKELLHGERILWEGQPDPNRLFTASDFFLVPFSLIWFSFAVFWESTALFMIPKDEPIGIIFPLFGLPFVLFGFYFAIGRFIYKKKKNENTKYLLTNKRALILTDFMGKNIQAIMLKDSPAINKSVRNDGTGSIQFGNTNFQSGMYSNTGLDFFNNFYGANLTAFYDIKNVNSVYKQVQEQRNSY